METGFIVYLAWMSVLPSCILVHQNLRKGNSELMASDSKYFEAVNGYYTGLSCIALQNNLRTVR